MHIRISNRLLCSFHYGPLIVIACCIAIEATLCTLKSNFYQPCLLADTLFLAPLGLAEGGQFTAGPTGAVLLLREARDSVA